jgi:hypothetical protein
MSKPRQGLLSVLFAYFSFILVTFKSGALLDRFRSDAAQTYWVAQLATVIERTGSAGPERQEKKVGARGASAARQTNCHDVEGAGADLLGAV